MLTYLKEQKKYLIFIGIILLIGLISGVVYYILLNSDIKENITETMINYNNFRYNSIIKDLIIMSNLLVTSLFLIGIPLGLFYLFYEGMSFGVILSIFIVNFKLSGLFYIIFYFLINKLLILLIMTLFIKKIINVGRYVIGMFIYHKDNLIKNKLIINLKNGLYLIVIIFVINIYFIL